MQASRETFAIGDAAPATRPLRIGVSSCLLGRPVRFDGQHKRNRMLLDHLAPHVEFVAVRPEVELGLGVPREAIRLVDAGGAVRLRGTRSGRDHTDAMDAYARPLLEDVIAEVGPTAETRRPAGTGETRGEQVRQQGAGGPAGGAETAAADPEAIPTAATLPKPPPADDALDFEEVEIGSPGVPRSEDLPSLGRPILEIHYTYWW